MEEVQIVSPVGSSGILHLYVAGFYRGQFIPIAGRWELRLQDQGSLPKEMARELELKALDVKKP